MISLLHFRFNSSAAVLGGIFGALSEERRELERQAEEQRELTEKSAQERKRKSEPVMQAPAPADYSIEAEVIAKRFIERRLKAPGSAKHPGIFSKQQPVVAHLGEGRYRVTSWVDSHNGFGALIRTNYSCIVTTNDGDNWQLESMDTW